MVRDRLTMWPANIHSAVRRNYGEESWEAAQQAAREKYGLHSIKNKNSLLVVATIEELWNRNERSQLLDEVTSSILTYVDA